MAKSQVLFGRNILEEAISVNAPISEIFFENEASRKFVESILSKSSLRISLKQGLPNDIRHQSHQGVAFFTAHDFYLSSLPDLKSLPFILMCNHLEDVQNLGAITRSAAAFGVNLMVHEDRRSVKLSPAAVKASAGFAFRMKFFQVSNLSYFAKHLTDAGFFVVGLEATGESQDLFEWKPQRPLALVVGAEGEGLSKPLKSACDFLVKIPMTQGVDSLNVSQATSIALAWIHRGQGT